MTHVWVEVVRNPLFEPIKVNVDKEGVPFSLHTGKRHREEFGQRRPVEPALTYRRGLERQAQSKHGLQKRIA